MEVRDNTFFISKVHRHTIFIYVVAKIVPKTFKFPFFGIKKWLLYGMHQLHTQFSWIIPAKEAKNKEV